MDRFFDPENEILNEVGAAVRRANRHLRSKYKIKLQLLKSQVQLLIKQLARAKKKYSKSQRAQRWTSSNFTTSKYHKIQELTSTQSKVAAPELEALWASSTPKASSTPLEFVEKVFTDYRFLDLKPISRVGPLIHRNNTDSNYRENQIARKLRFETASSRNQNSIYQSTNIPILKTAALPPTQFHSAAVSKYKFTILIENWGKSLNKEKIGAFLLQVTPKDTFLRVKKKIEKVKEIQVDRQYLRLNYFSFKSYDDHQTLEAAGVRHGNSVFLYALPGSPCQVSEEPPTPKGQKENRIDGRVCKVCQKKFQGEKHLIILYYG